MSNAREPIVATAAGPRATPRPRELALSAEIALGLVYEDRTRFGSAVTGRCDVELRTRFAVVAAYRRRYGLQRLVRNAAAILERVAPAALDGICEAPDRLREAWLYPVPTQVSPAAICVIRDLGDVTARIPLTRELSADLASYLGDWQHGAKAPRARGPRALWQALADAGALTPVESDRAPSSPRGVTYVGHATVRVSDGAQQLLVDPYLLQRSQAYGTQWQPLSLRELGRPDAVLITHSHPDHYDLGTLLRSGADTPIYVPAVRRESVLAVDMATRLRDLGFRAVHAVEPWSEFAVGAMRVFAMPFYGEQPTVGAILHPEVRNDGANYVIEALGRRVAVLADAGVDWSGNVKEMASRARDLYGPLDILFAGYRGFSMYPVQYLFSSVSRYLPFVPRSSWSERQPIMCDADDAIDVGERWRAKQIVPYAAGGAPWYWLRGLGPCLDGSSPEDAFTHTQAPEYVNEVAARRSHTRLDGPLASPVDVTVLRPGDHVPF